MAFTTGSFQISLRCGTISPYLTQVDVYVWKMTKDLGMLSLRAVDALFISSVSHEIEYCYMPYRESADSMWEIFFFFSVFYHFISKDCFKQSVFGTQYNDNNYYYFKTNLI